MPRAAPPDGIDRLMKKAIEARTAKEATAIIDQLGKYGEDAVYAIQAVVDQTSFDKVRAHGLDVIRDVKSEDTQF